jgi:CRP/FNR family transcriptional regulator, polysaccharide utilization system transcription regulator
MLDSNQGSIGQVEEDNSIFDQLKPNERAVFEKNINIARYKKNDYIYREGEIPEHMLYLKEGKVKLIKDGINGREQIIRMITSNGFIGYRALIANEPYNGTAISIEDSAIIAIPLDILYNVLLRNYGFSISLLRDMAIELGFSNHQTVSLTQKHIRGRLADSLLLLRQKYGFEHDNMTLRARLSRFDLANLSNMTVSNAIRTLSTFAFEKVIEIDGRMIKILDLKKLERISRLG